LLRVKIFLTLQSRNIRPEGAVFTAEKNMLARRNTSPRLAAPQLALVETTPETSFEETNREFLAALGDLSVEGWYRQNGLGYTQPTPTNETMADLEARWGYLTGAVELDDLTTSDTQFA
jgi:hypothetical protein